MSKHLPICRAAIAALALMLGLPSILRAQAATAPAATVTGTITDATHAVLPGVTVTVVNLGDGTTAAAVSDAAGAYRLSVREGVYTITAELAGFAPASRDRIEAAGDAPIVIDLSLAPGLAETVSVTGTHLRSRGFEARVPLQVESRQDIESSGLANFSDIFKEIPGNTGSEAAAEAAPRQGQSQFNLRGLGYSSTLTLINGRRAGVAPLSDESGAEFTDINQFPLAMVERVDVLKDGASAIYGSDAVAGVVNVITRRGFEGVEASAGFQSASNRDGFVNLATGRKFARGMLNVYGTYYTQTGNDRTDFDWLVQRVGGNGVLGRSQLLNNNGAPSTYRIGGLNASGQPIGLTGGVGAPDPDCEAAGGVFRIRDDGTVDRSQCLYNFADQVSIIPNASRVQVFSEFSYQLTDGVKLSTEASVSRNVLDSTRGPGGYTNGSVVANGAGNVYIPASHPFNFFTRDPADPTRLIYVPPANWNPSVNQAVDVVASLRPLGGQAYNGDHAPKRRSQTNYPRVSGALDFSLARNWTATAAYQYAAADFTDMQPLRYNADALTQAIASGAFNPFGTAITNPTLVSPKNKTSVAGNSQAAIDSFVTASTDVARTRQHEVDVTASGDAFSLRGQKVSLAAGAQFRRVTLESVPDALQASGHGDVPSPQFPQSGAQNVTAAFAEVAAPIGSIVSTQIAARFENYGRYGSTVNPKVAGSIALGHRASLRASWGTSFQAPTLFQTSRSTTRLFLNDPVALIGGRLVCQSATTSAGNVTVNTEGDSNLKPQHSRNHNLGLVVEPVRRLQVSVDYWNYHYTDLIASSASAQAIVNNDCNDGIPDDPRVARDTTGAISEINTSFVNVGKVDTDGIDFALAFRWPLSLGIVGATVDATWLRQFDVVGGEGGIFDGAGSRNFANNFRTMPRWRAVTGVNWTRSAQSAAAKLRYTGRYTNDQSNNAMIDDYMPIDLSYGYTFSIAGRRAWTVRVGIDNVFDLDPPALVRNDATGTRIPSTNLTYIDRPGYDAYSGADLRGRVAWIRFAHTF